MLKRMAVKENADNIVLELCDVSKLLNVCEQSGDLKFFVDSLMWT